MLNRLILFYKQLSERQRLLLLLAVAFSLRLYAVLAAKGIAIDGAYYGFMARDFLEGDYVKGLAPAFHPFYPLLIALIAPDTAHVEIAGRLVSLIFGTLTLVPLYYLFKEAVGEKEAILGGLFYCFHPYLVTYSGMLLSEATYWGLLTLSIYLFWIGLSRRRAFELLTSAAFLGMAYLTRPEGLGYLIVFLIWVVIYGGVKEEWFRKTVLAGGLVVIFSIFFVPYVLHIHQETGRWLISKKAVESQVGYLSKEGVESQIRYFSSAEDKGDQVKAGPTEGSPAVSTGLRGFFYRLPFTAYAYLRAYYATLWIFLFFGLIRTARRRGKGELFLATLVLLHVVSLAAVIHSTERFSVPVVAFSLFWAGAGVGELTRVLQKLGVSKPGSWVASLVILTLLVQLPMSLKPVRRHREDQKKTGIWLKQNTPEGAVIMSNSPQQTFYADREFIALPARTSVPQGPGTVYREVIGFARKNRVRYILVDGNTRDYNPDFFESIRSTELMERYKHIDQRGNSTIVYEVIY